MAKAMPLSKTKMPCRGCIEHGDRLLILRQIVSAKLKVPARGAPVSLSEAKNPRMLAPPRRKTTFGQSGSLETFRAELSVSICGVLCLSVFLQKNTKDTTQRLKNAIFWPSSKPGSG
jgi:hypothetical protein